MSNNAIFRICVYAGVSIYFLTQYPIWIVVILAIGVMMLDSKLTKKE